jgi:RNA polymerase sigma factor (sigma-70 family)
MFDSLQFETLISRITYLLN